MIIWIKESVITSAFWYFKRIAFALAYILNSHVIIFFMFIIVIILFIALYSISTLYISRRILTEKRRSREATNIPKNRGGGILNHRCALCVGAYYTQRYMVLYITVYWNFYDISVISESCKFFQIEGSVFLSFYGSSFYNV